MAKKNQIIFIEESQVTNTVAMKEIHENTITISEQKRNENCSFFKNSFT